MSHTVSPSTSRSYGLARVSRMWNVSRSGMYRFLKAAPSTATGRRRGPVGACLDAELADHIRQQIEASDFHGEGYRKIWARLRFAGVRASPRRVRRVMGENGLLAPHRAGRAEAKTHDGTIITDRVNEMWGTDMTQTVTFGEGRAYVFVAVEHANSEIVGIHASRSANRFEALEPVRQGVNRCFGAIVPGVARGLKLRHDHSSNYMSGDFQDEIKCLGIEASPSFVREPEGNGVAERFIRTLKENLLWVSTFNTIEYLRVALVAFARRY
jgi:putative transposase